ncbi:hypothetical protein BKA69DRAFT_1127674 [Paraphysoderma sedebokerense]|nr:hypothetical protein BKA69DRAFT_1127674 [Paraphysoderma sedebokerense]
MSSNADNAASTAPCSVVHIPPLPPKVVHSLQTSSFAYLATSSNNIPHLSLMNYTFQNDQLHPFIILSTRRDTKKFQHVMQNSNVALLVHDFSGTRESTKDQINSKSSSSNSSSSPSADRTSSSSSPNLTPDSDHLTTDDSTKKYSITLNGHCTVIPSSSKEESVLREIHLKTNPQYRNFIVGEDISILKVTIDSCRICDVNDYVEYWSAGNRN